jgi:DNA-binding NarL/FixJ family response regulator
MHTQQAIPTIVVSRPGVMQEALRTSLSVCPAITVLASIGDGLTAVKQIEAQHPQLVVIDANLLPEETEALIAAIKAGQRPARCLVFVQSSRHEAMMTTAGADAVILRDSSAGELHAVLVSLTAPEP